MADGGGNERPHFLSDEKVNWVVNTPGNSLFSVKVSVRALVEEDIKIAKDAKTALGKLRRSRVSGEKGRPRVSPNMESSYITGFAIGEERGMIRIITSTQGIKEILPQKIGYPSVEQINSVFKFEVKCLHEEERLKQEQSEDGSPYWNATLLHSDCRKDLLLLEVDVKAKCNVDHPAIRLATSHPSESTGMLVFLHGWPVHCEGSVTRGRISHIGRQVTDVLGGPSEFMYDMKLTEIFGGCCSKGFSGGPVVNGDLDCLGVFHQNYNSNGYATSWEDVAQFLSDLKG